MSPSRPCRWQGAERNEGFMVTVFIACYGIESNPFEVRAEV